MIPDAKLLDKDGSGGLECGMRKTRTWLFFFLPVLYVTVILGFIAFQFSKKSDSFSQSLGDLTVSGKTTGGGQPADLTLRGRGLAFVFDAAHPIQAEGSDGTSSKLRPLSWNWKDGNVVVVFQSGLQMVFEKAETGGRSLLIHPLANDSLKKYTALHVPFSLDGGARAVSSTRTYQEVTRDKSRLLVSLDGAQDRFESENTFVLTVGKNGFRPARLDPLPPDVPAALAWLTLDSRVTPETAETSLSQYWDKAYASWSSASIFTTRLADSWSRESLLRGDYLTTFGRIQNLLNRDPKAWGFDAMGYLGNMVDLTAQQRRSVESASSRAQPDWAGQGRLWLDAKFYGPDSSADRVKSILLTGKLPDDVPGLLAVAQNLRTIQTLQPSDAVTSRVSDVMTALAAKVVRREGDLFVRSGDNLLDLKSSLLVGRLWLDYSRSFSSQTFGSAGAQLVASALGYQDPAGRLPETLVTQDGKVVRQEGTVLSEEVYPWLRPVVGTETDLPEWGAGSFVRTPAKSETRAITAAQARFTFRFPAGAAEHIVMVGVPAFDHITMHGIRWRTDPQFQSYTDGWAYSASTKTLFVKIKHREDLEELVIHFQPEQ